MMHAPASAPDTPDLHAWIQRFCASASFEVAARDLAGLQAAAEFLPPGAAVSITWLPNETDATRVAAAVAIRKAGFEPVPHIAARRLASREAFARFLGSLRDEAGVTQALLVAGDLAHAQGPFSSSLEALRTGAFEAAGFTSIGLAGHPERHPAVDQGILERALDAKIERVREGGMDCFVISQFCFAAQPIVSWMSQVRSRHPDLPVRVGLAGPASLKTLLRFAAFCGVGASAGAIVSRGASIARLLTEAGPDPVIRDLAASDAFRHCDPVALHLFPFGGLARTARWNAEVVAGRFHLRPGESGFQLDDWR